MAVIAIVVDTEQGHIISSFSLAKKLLARGHRVCYLGLAVVENMVLKQGFEFRRIMDGLLSSSDLIQLRPPDGNEADTRIVGKFWGLLMRGAGVDGPLLELSPDVILMTSLYYFEALVLRYRYNVPVIVINSTDVCECRKQVGRTVVDSMVSMPGAAALIDLLLSAKVEIRNFADVAALILQMPELRLQPKVFELPGASQDPLVFYVGPEVDLDRVDEPYDWSRLQTDRPLIYCSLGSQLDLRGEVSRRLVRTVIEAAAQRPDWQFVISLGARLSATEFEPIPSSVILNHWVPQLQMLARASVMITHAGIGSVKECILHGVPMLALPLMRDQFDTADRIVYHRLGFRGDIERIGAEDLASMLDQLIINESFRERVRVMREEFQRAEAQNLGVTLIEKVIAGCLPVDSH